MKIKDKKSKEKKDVKEEKKEDAKGKTEKKSGKLHGDPVAEVDF